MKKMKAFLSRHPILDMFAFNAILIPIAVGIGFLIRSFTGFAIENILFGESLLVLMMCYGAINGNASSRTAGYVYDPSIMSQHDYYLGAYHFAIKYGILGVALFVLSGYIGTF